MKKILIITLIVAFVFSIFGIAYAVSKKDLVTFRENIYVARGFEYNDVVAILGDIDVSGQVNGNVVSVLGSIQLHPTAKVMGDTVSVGGKITRFPGAEMVGGSTEINLKGMENLYFPLMGMALFAGAVVFGIFRLIGFLCLAWLIVMFAEKMMKNVALNIEKAWVTDLLFGLLGLILIIPVAALLAITIIGIPFVLVEAVVVAAALILGNVAVSYVIGRRIFKMIKRKKQAVIIETIAGFLALVVIEIIPIIGGIVKFAATTTGFGAAIVTKFGTAKK